MIRKSLIPVAIAAAFAIGGCAGTGGSLIGPNIGTVQQATVAVCGYLPTIQTVANILANGNAIISTADAVAQAICAAVTAKGARRGGAAPMVNGVAVRGRFVN